MTFDSEQDIFGFSQIAIFDMKIATFSYFLRLMI